MIDWGHLVDIPLIGPTLGASCFLISGRVHGVRFSDGGQPLRLERLGGCRVKDEQRSTEQLFGYSNLKAYSNECQPANQQAAIQ